MVLAVKRKQGYANKYNSQWEYLFSLVTDGLGRRVAGAYGLVLLRPSPRSPYAVFLPCEPSQIAMVTVIELQRPHTSCLRNYNVQIKITKSEIDPACLTKRR